MNVYCITFPNGKRYVGVESYTGQRKSIHAHSHTISSTKRLLVSNAIIKYGWQNCKFEYLIMDKSKEECWALEKEKIAEWKLQDRKYGYNISSGGDGSPGWHWSEEDKRKISERQKANPPLSMLGKHHSEETKRKIGLANQVSLKGNIPWNKGKLLSQDHINKLKKVWDNIKRKQLSEQRIGSGNPMFGKKHTLEVREKIRTASYKMWEIRRSKYE